MTPQISAFGPDFTFAFDDWLTHPAGLGSVPEELHGTEVAVAGGGLAGIVASYELMKMGLKPVIYEAGRLGGRLRSEPFGDDPEIVAELGGMRFPESGKAFFHYVNKVGLNTSPFPNPLTPAAPTTVIDLDGVSHYAETEADLPDLFHEVSTAWNNALEEEIGLSQLQEAIANRDAEQVKERWNSIVEAWDGRSFFDFVNTSQAFQRLTFKHREVFGQVGFGTGGWDSDFSNSMLEILRVVLCNFEENQHLLVGGAEQLPRRIWEHVPEELTHWPAGTSLASLHDGEPRSAVTKIRRDGIGDFIITDRDGHTNHYGTLLMAMQSWLLTTNLNLQEDLLPYPIWMALDRTRYMQSSKTFVMVDRPFWTEVNEATGRQKMSMTLTDRSTRGTYLFNNGPDRPGVICLSYAWMSDAMKVLPKSAEERAELALDTLEKIYDPLDIRAHVIGDPITVSWEADPNFLGAFKGALPGHYRYNQRMYSHFFTQQLFRPHQQGLFLAGDDVSFTPGWAEGAVQTALNAVWGITNWLGGSAPTDNPGPGEHFPRWGPIDLGE